MTVDRAQLRRQRERSRDGAMVDRFLDKIILTDGCWDWAANKDQDGYGRISRAGLLVHAHRVSYELFRGPIPDGLQVDHLCSNTSCVRPSHLEPVTCLENNMRGVVPKKRAKPRCKRGHEYTPENLIPSKRGWRRCRQCANEGNQRRRAALRASREGGNGG